MEKYYCSNHISSMFYYFIVLFFSLKDVIKWKIDSNETEQQVEKIQEIVEIEEVQEVEEIEETEEIEIIEQEKEIPKANPYWDYIKINLIHVDFEELKIINQDVKG